MDSASCTRGNAAKAAKRSKAFIRTSPIRTLLAEEYRHEASHFGGGAPLGATRSRAPASLERRLSALASSAPVLEDGKVVEREFEGEDGEATVKTPVRVLRPEPLDGLSPDEVVPHRRVPLRPLVAPVLEDRERRVKAGVVPPVRPTAVPLRRFRQERGIL